VRQRIELTGTNSSIGLIALISNAHMLLAAYGFREMILVVGNDSGENRKTVCFNYVFGRTGGFSGGPVPDPISNSAVKLPSADGTKS
jgi:hypothetical protein